MNKSTAILILMICLSSCVIGQQQIQSSLYIFHPQLVNPAFAGIEGDFTAAAGQRLQWVGIDGYPRSTMFSAGMPIFGKKSRRSTRGYSGLRRRTGIGIGLNIFQERVGNLRSTSFYTDVSYTVKVNRYGDKLSFGLRAGGDLVSLNYNDLFAIDESDYLKTRSYANKFLGNMGFGIFYHGNDWFVSIGTPKLLRSKLDEVDNVKIGRQVTHSYLSGGYSYDLSNDLKFIPTLNIKTAVNAPMSFESNLNFLYTDKFWFGLLYRLQDAIGANFLVAINKDWSVGYAYDYTISLQEAAFGSHELMIGY
ncbi:MAG: type IX secretion system membrane protein PorP/SprF, partial [Flavobacteriales bacterium]|nr:type IX secretion system membrane protein PorP/SprF [Flavobacteriales bacterium]